MQDFNFILPYSRVTSSKFNYRYEIGYCIKNIFSTFLIPFKLDLNHLFVSEGINSITIKTHKVNEVHDKFSLSSNITFIKTLENIIKGLSIVEMEIFRGNYHYIFTSNFTFVGKIPFLFALVLTVLYLFFSVIEQFHSNELWEESNKPGEMFIIMMLIQFIPLLIFTHMEIINKYNSLFTLSHLHVFFICILGNVIILLKLKKRNIEILAVYNNAYQSLMAFNFFFVNYGIGLLWIITIYANELKELLLKKDYFLLKKLNKVDKVISAGNQILKLIISFLFVYAIAGLDYKTIYENFILSSNNIYPLIICGLIILMYRISEEITVLVKSLTDS